MYMAQDTAITIRVSKEWLAKLDAWIEKQPIRPSRTEVIRVAVERLTSDKKGAK
jgi:Arc/MetJ-type ribon-helix-helix transcriptional regulator